ncbi:MAG: aminotransferase class IV [Anaerohalosphaera sp.]|nr:aminotransferase class IV [Anaerohalosphaera sp.]
MIDDKIVALKDLDKVYTDRGTYFGDGVYEVLRSYNGIIFKLDEHLARFRRSLCEIYIDNVNIDDIRNKVITAFNQAGFANAKIYFHVTRGSENRSHAPERDISPNFFMTVTELADNSAKKTNGIKACTQPDLRWKRCDIKSLNLLPNVLAKMEAAKKGCAEAILVDEKGDITEGAGSAFFMIKGSELITRPLGREILPSITRQIVEQIAENAGLTVVERTITAREAKTADELLLAVTTDDIVGIIEFDSKPIGNGKVGQSTRKLMAEFNKTVQQM